MAMLAELVRSDPTPDAAFPKGRVIVSRFGPIVVQPTTAISFPSGLLGFPGLRDYALASLPDERFNRFLVLQSLEDDGVAFLVQALDPDQGLIAAADLNEMCALLDVPREHLALLLIVSIRRHAEKAVLTVNLRAPLVVNAQRRRGVQHVLSNGVYPIRHVL